MYHIRSIMMLFVRLIIALPKGDGVPISYQINDQSGILVCHYIFLLITYNNKDGNEMLDQSFIAQF